MAGIQSLLDRRPRRLVVMGVLNVTPDSFYDGGRYQHLDRALMQAERLVAEGAEIIDVGGESTRPGACPVSESEEIDRVVPVVDALHARIGCAVSIDTSKPVVMRAAVAAGASMINDVRALRAPGAIEAAAELRVPVCLMHMQGEPRTMQEAPQYVDVVEDVAAFLVERAAAACAGGVPREALIVDPGFGFGKRIEHNLALLRDLGRIAALGYPVLVGLSRKSMIGTLLGRPVEQRLPASLALAVIAVLKGARIIRVHDVAPTVDALRMAQAVIGEDAGE
jgi:dihydropteroate synthase